MLVPAGKMALLRTEISCSNPTYIAHNVGQSAHDEWAYNLRVTEAQYDAQDPDWRIQDPALWPLPVEPVVPPIDTALSCFYASIATSAIPSQQ
jgi:hypothetical protein